jgi:hypothetical protein
VFHWEEVRVNLPGTWNYDLTRPRLYKIRFDQSIAGNLVIYIEEAWQASSRVAKTCVWLGLQDAARKRREPSTEPGAWVGTVMWATEANVEKMVIQERWEKTKDKIDWMWRVFQGECGGDILEHCPEGCIPHTKLESIQGFMVYVARTYSTMVPYLKVIHLTLDSWRAKQGADRWPVDKDGWRISNKIDNRLEDADARQGGGYLRNLCEKRRGWATI